MLNACKWLQHVDRWLRWIEYIQLTAICLQMPSWRWKGRLHIRQYSIDNPMPLQPAWEEWVRMATMEW